MSEIETDLLHVKMDVEIEHELGLEILFRGNPVIYYDGNFNRFNGAPYTSETPGKFRFDVEMLLNKTPLKCSFSIYWFTRVTSFFIPAILFFYFLDWITTSFFIRNK